MYCPNRFAEPSGCRETIDRGWLNSEAGDIEPWIQWMKRHKGENARFMGMTTSHEGNVKLFYGVPAANGEEAAQ